MKLPRLEDAIAVYNKSLMEHRNADTLALLNKTEKALKEAREREYINLELCEQERDKGNTAFKEQRYPEVGCGAWGCPYRLCCHHNMVAVV